MTRQPFYSHLYVQVFAAIVLGAVAGFVVPETAVDTKFLGDAFIKLIKMIVAPIVFVTVAVGIAKMGDLKKVGVVGAKALLYFEIMSTLALVGGLVVANLVAPGAGVHADPATLDAGAVAAYTQTPHHQGFQDFLLNLVPGSVVDAFARGDILQVLVFSVLFGAGLGALGARGKPLLDLLDQTAHALFQVVGMVMKLAPLGAFGAMAFAVGRYGSGTLVSLVELMLTVYAACVLFVLLAMGTAARLAGVSILKFMAYIKDEMLIVFGTASSEAVLPRLITKLENMGCGKSVVGLVVPTGYTFNLDGTAIYLTAAVMFIAQATDVPLSLDQQLTILAVLLLTSKGIAGVAGASLITLGATLATVETLPVAGLTLLLGIDRLIDMGRSVTNLVGNGVAAVVVARWEGALDRERAEQVLNGRIPPEEAAIIEDAVEVVDEDGAAKPEAAR